MSLAMSEKGPSLQDIRAARQRLAGVIYLSPCAYSETVSQLAGARTSFKLENLQMTGSFKERGAANRLLTLSEAERVRGVVAASAGNHGLAVAFHARRLGIRATIVMPEWAPLIKVTSARRDGAKHGVDERGRGVAELVGEEAAGGAATFGGRGGGDVGGVAAQLGRQRVDAGESLGLEPGQQLGAHDARRLPQRGQPERVGASSAGRRRRRPRTGRGRPPRPAYP